MRNVNVKRTACNVLLSASILLPLPLAQAADTRAVPPLEYIQAKDPSPSAKLAAVQPTNAKLSKDKALAFAKSYVQLPPGAELSNASFHDQDSWRSFPEWSFSWVQKDENGRDTGTTISVSIHADNGELTSYYIWDNKANTTTQPIERSAAAKVAEQFLKTHAKAKASQVRLYERDTPAEKPPLNNRVTYSFRFIRVVNDTLFPDNEINIEVDGSGRVTGYYLNWNDNITFPQVDELISEEQAGEAFRSAARAKPVYTFPWETDRSKPFLIYQNPFDFLVDAQTGEPLTHLLEQLPAEQTPVPVSSQPLTPHNSGGVLSQEAAVRLAGKLFNLSGFQLESVNYYENERRRNNGSWTIHYRSNDESPENRRYLTVTLDAKTGDVLSYYRDLALPLFADAGKVKKVDWSAAEIRERAIAAVRKYAPSLASQLYVSSEPLDPIGDERVSVQFYRLIGDIQAATGTATVTFNLREGEMESFNSDVGWETYPSTPPTYVSEEEAVSAWWEEAELELVYTQQPLDGDQSANKERTAKLVYRVKTSPFTEPYALHAETKEWISLASGKTISLHRETPSDIIGHPAEKQLMLMYEYDAITPIDGKLMPERAITRGEMIKMLMITTNNGYFYVEKYAQREASFADVTAGSPYFAYVEAAVEQGLLSTRSNTLKPDEPITRRELADMLVRGLGLHKLADYKSMFSSNATDVAAEDRGVIAIVTGLGIMTAENGQFAPDRIVSRANAAVAFSRFLEKRNELNLGIAPYNMYGY